MSDVKSDASQPASISRRERALATRRRITRAAAEEFEARGYHAVTMSAIAARAGVAVQTVHFVFHTKGELLGAVVDSAVLGEDDPTPPDRTAWFRAVLEETDPHVALHTFVTAGGSIFTRASAMNEVARSAATTDPDALATFGRLERLRADNYRDVLTAVLAHGTLREGLDLDSATDVMLALVSPRTYLSLTRDRGWSAERAIEWMADAAVTMVLT